MRKCCLHPVKCNLFAINIITWSNHCILLCCLIAFWSCLKNLLGVHELKRYEILHSIKTDAGRGRAWLRASLNERTLECSVKTLLSSSQLLKWVFVIMCTCNCYGLLIDNMKLLLFTITEPLEKAVSHSSCTLSYVDDLSSLIVSTYQGSMKGF